MAFKINIQPDIEAEMDKLLKKTPFRSKTEYINQAIASFNHQLKRQLELAKLKTYFKNYPKEDKEILHDFSQVRRVSN